MNGNSRAEQTFPVTENLADAEFLIGGNRPTPDLYRKLTNGRLIHKESFSIELEPKVLPIFVLLEPSYQRLHTNMQPPDSEKGCYCAVAGAAGAAGAP